MSFSWPTGSRTRWFRGSGWCLLMARGGLGRSPRGPTIVPRAGRRTVAASRLPPSDRPNRRLRFSLSPQRGARPASSPTSSSAPERPFGAPTVRSSPSWGRWTSKSEALPSASMPRWWCVLPTTRRTARASFVVCGIISSSPRWPPATPNRSPRVTTGSPTPCGLPTRRGSPSMRRCIPIGISSRALTLLSWMLAEASRNG